MSKLHTFAAILLLPALMAGCQNEPEEPPDITEAIPLDDVEDQAGAETEESPEPGIEPSAPPIMESGSNENGGRQPDPSRSKLVPAE